MGYTWTLLPVSYERNWETFRLEPNDFHCTWKGWSLQQEPKISNKRTWNTSVKKRRWWHIIIFHYIIFLHRWLPLVSPRHIFLLQTNIVTPGHGNNNIVLGGSSNRENLPYLTLLVAAYNGLKLSKISLVNDSFAKLWSFFAKAKMR